MPGCAAGKEILCAHRCEGIKKATDQWDMFVPATLLDRVTAVAFLPRRTSSCGRSQVCSQFGTWTG